MYTEEDMLMLSGIQHYMFCPRQWGLIHLSQEWEDKCCIFSWTFANVDYKCIELFKSRINLSEKLLLQPSQKVWYNILNLRMLHFTCRTPCGCVDWNQFLSISHESPFCHTPCGCVDWNKDQTDSKNAKKLVAPHVGAWIETGTSGIPWIARYVAPHVGAWIETTDRKECLEHRAVAPHVGAWIETRPKENDNSALLRRTPCGCVDWNNYGLTILRITPVAPHVGAWIETIWQDMQHKEPWRRTPCGCVDWTPSR